MPLKNSRTRTGTDGGKRSGKRNVVYVDAKGNSFNALVVGQGTSSGLKLRLTSQSAANRIVDNVAIATAVGGPGYHDRTPNI